MATQQTVALVHEYRGEEGGNDAAPTPQLSNVYRQWMKQPPQGDEDWEQDGGTVKLTRKFVARNKAESVEANGDLIDHTVKPPLFEFVSFTEELSRNKKKIDQRHAGLRARLGVRIDKPEAPAHVTDARFETCHAYDEKLVGSLDSLTKIDVVRYVLKARRAQKRPN